MRNMDRGITAEGYTWQGVLGEGAFATVLLCKRVQDGKLFAAKVMDFERNRRLKWEAENEIEIMKDLRRHPYIVSLCDVIRQPDSTMLMLEYVPGTSFLHGLAGWSNFTESDAQVTMKQLFQATGYCHRHHIVHRDLSPLNILWVQRPTPSNPDVTPWLKIIDFNLARRISDGKNVVECDPLGTDMFMSPESLQDKSQIGLQHDIWSLGVILFFCLVGYPPFWCDNYIHLLKNIEEGCYSMPKKHWSTVSSEAHDLVREMLTVKLSKRITAVDALKHPWFRKRVYVETKSSSELSLIQSRILVYLDRTRPSNRLMWSSDQADHPVSIHDEVILRGFRSFPQDDKTFQRMPQREIKKQINKMVFPSPSARKAYVPDKELETLALQIRENNNA